MVTGGASGIGASVAARFAEAGASGVVLDLPGALADAELPPGWHGVSADVTNESSVCDAIEEAEDLLSGLDAVVAAAGVVPGWARPAELDLDDFDRVLAVNARGVACTIKHAAGRLHPGGTITVVASLNSWQGDPNISAYVASKHAALGIVRSAALALGRDGVRVNAVAPGPVATRALQDRMNSRAGDTGLELEQALAQAASKTALGRIATAAEVADAILFLTSSLSSGITGQLLNVDSGIA